MPYGAGKYQYELIEGWVKLPKGWTFLDIGGIAIGKDDRVYVLNRSEHPMIVFDRDGNLIDSWGEGFFKCATVSALARMTPSIAPTMETT